MTVEGQSWRMRLVWPLGIVCPCCHVHGQNWAFTRIADASTAVPGSSSPFALFNAPSIGNGVVGFAGFNANLREAGVYLGSGGALSVVADRHTLSPGGTNFVGFAQGALVWPSINSGQVAFHAGDGVEGGIFLRTGSTINPVATTLIPVPSGAGGNFGVTGAPSLQDGRIAFVGSEFGGVQRGVYSWEGGALSVVADRSTPVPQGAGAFTDFFDSDLDKGQIIFTAEGQGSHRGLYRSDAGGLTRLYDTTMAVPGGNGGNFTFLGQAVLSDGRIAFWGAGGGTEGVYTDVGGQLAVVANHGTPPPGVSWFSFGGFSSVSIDHGVVAFDAISGGGAFSGVFSTHTGSLAKVLASGDLLDGRIVADAGIGAQAIDGDSMAIWVSFTNGSYGIYRATIPAPGTAVMLLLGAASAARRRRVR